MGEFPPADFRQEFFGVAGAAAAALVAAGLARRLQDLSRSDLAKVQVW